MGPVVENLLIFILNRVLTPEVIKGAEQELVDFLKVLAAKSANGIDDEFVKFVAIALGVNY